MDRGFNSNYRGNFQNRHDRRRDEFYSDRDRRSGNYGARGNANRGSSRDQGFFGGQQGNQSSGQNSVIAALQLQNQNLMNAFIRNSQPQSRSNNFNQQGKGYQVNSGNGFRPGDKRRQQGSSGPSGFKKSKPTSNKANAPPPRRSSSSSSSAKRKDPPKEEVSQEEEIPDIPDNEVEVPDSLMDSVEKLRMRKEVERNVADEDVDKLVVFCFTGKGYQCLTCGLLLTRDAAFKGHLMAKGHVMNVIDARTAKKYQETRDILDIDLQPDGWYETSEKARQIILKQAKLIMKIEIQKKKRDEENYNKDPKNFFAVNMSLKKAATVKDDVVRITSIVESTIDVKEFSKDRFFGCEFVKVVASFQCRLCDMKISSASEVILHIDSRVHRNKYQMHLKRNPDYEKTQREQNKELGTILLEHEGNPVLLSESSTRDKDKDKENTEKTLIDEINPCLIRVPEILNPTVKEDTKEETPAEEAVANKPNEDTEQSKTENTDQVEDKNEQDKQEKGGNVRTEDELTTVDKVKGEPMDIRQIKSEKTEEEPTSAEGSSEKTSNETVSDDKETTVNEKVNEKDDENSAKNISEIDDKEDALDEQTESKETVETPKKTVAKKGRGGSAKRGTPRNRGGKAAASPRTRTRKQQEETPKEKDEVEAINEDAKEKTDDTNDGNFMDGFQVVDEVKDD